MANIRDSKGRLLKGHPRLNNQPGHCGGAPKTIIGEVKDALKMAENAMPEIFLSMIQRARDSNDPQAQRAAEYLADRIYGKPNQPLTGMGGKALEIIVRWDGNRHSDTPETAA